jgi:hypothetical protein
MEWMDIINIVGYPVVGWLAYKGGKLDGITVTIQVLHEKGLLEFEEEPEEL